MRAISARPTSARSGSRTLRGSGASSRAPPGRSSAPMLSSRLRVHPGAARCSEAGAVGVSAQRACQGADQRMPPIWRAASTYIVYFVAVGAAFPYLPVHYRALGLNLGTIGLLAALSAATQLVAAPAWGAIADQFGRSRLTLPAASIVAASGALAATIEAAGNVKRERPNWSAMAPQAGAATSWVAAESAANSPIVPRFRPSAR